MFEGSLSDTDVTQLHSRVFIGGQEYECLSWEVDRDLKGDLPDQVVARSGLTAATGRLVLSGRGERNLGPLIQDNDMWFRSAQDDAGRVESYPVNPFNPGFGAVPYRGQAVQIFVAHDSFQWQRFEGIVDRIAGTVGGNITVNLIDTTDRLSAEVNHEPLLRIMPPLSEGSQRRGVGLTALYYIDMAARAAGYHCTPPREPNASLVVHGQTSLWPEAGTLQTTTPRGGSSVPSNRRNPGWMGLENFDATYTPWGGYRASEPLQMTMVIGTSHQAIAYMQATYAGGSTVMLRVDALRGVSLRINGSIRASLQLSSNATVVSALVENGQVVLRTNDGTETTGSGTLSGATMSTVRIWAEVGANIAGLQVSHPDAGRLRLVSTAWERTAWLDTGSVALMESIQAAPRIDQQTAYDLLHEVTDAILSASWVDETGVLRVVPSDVLRAREPVHTVTTLDDVLSLDWEDSVLQSPSKVSVKYQMPAITSSIYRNVVVWEGSKKELTAGEEHTEFIEPSGNEDWIMVQDVMTKVGAFSSSSWDYVNANRRTVGGGYYAVDGDLISTQPEGFTVDMEQLGISRYLIRHRVNTAPANAVLITAAPNDHPNVWDTREGDTLPRVNAFGHVQRTTETVSAVTVSGPGPELVHDAGPWVSDSAAANIANYVAGQTMDSQPIITGLRIVPDPRLQLGDMIEIHSDTLMGVRITALIIGISEGMDDSGMRQSLTVRVRSVRTMTSTYESWDNQLSGDQMTYSAFNHLPPSPQTYENLNFQ